MSVMLESQGDPIQISRLTTLPPKYVKEKIDFFLDEDAGTCLLYTSDAADE